MIEIGILVLKQQVNLVFRILAGNLLLLCWCVNIIFTTEPLYAWLDRRRTKILLKNTLTDLLSLTLLWPKCIFMYTYVCICMCVHVYPHLYTEATKTNFKVSPAYGSANHPFVCQVCSTPVPSADWIKIILFISPTGFWRN